MENFLPSTLPAIDQGGRDERRGGSCPGWVLAEIRPAIGTALSLVVQAVRGVGQSPVSALQRRRRRRLPRKAGRLAPAGPAPRAPSARRLRRPPARFPRRRAARPVATCCNTAQGLVAAVPGGIRAVARRRSRDSAARASIESPARSAQGPGWQGGGGGGRGALVGGGRESMGSWRLRVDRAEGPAAGAVEGAAVRAAVLRGAGRRRGGPACAAEEGGARRAGVGGERGGEVRRGCECELSIVLYCDSPSRPSL